MRKLFLVVFLSFIWINTAYSAEYATFEVFYKDSSSIGWIIAGVGALLAAGLIFFTGGTASPIVVGIGTWIGGFMGLSGIAATNAGLALLGGGSIAAGGFGIIGGVTVLTAALSFGTDIVLDITVNSVISEYNYNKMAEQSKNMTTLPVPKNTSGPYSYQEAMKVLEQINADEPIGGNNNSTIIKQAINALMTT